MDNPRIKRPELPYTPPVEEATVDEELSQDDINEWVVQKIIRLELEQFRKEPKAKPPAQTPTQTPAKKRQPYEDMYGTQEEKPVKAPKKMSNKRLILLLILVAGAVYLGYLAYQYLVLGYTFGS